MSAEIRYDREYSKNEVYDGGETANLQGTELLVARMISARWGKIDNPSRYPTGTTWGFGIGLGELLPFGIRFDYANIPEANDQPDLDVYALSVSLDPRRAGFR